jgi:hypothetical protein
MKRLYDISADIFDKPKRKCLSCHCPTMNPYATFSDVYAYFQCNNCKMVYLLRILDEDRYNNIK